MNQMLEIYLEHAQHDIEQLQRLVATVRGEIAATNMVVHALAIAQRDPDFMTRLIDSGEKQYSKAMPDIADEFRTGFVEALDALRKTLDNHHGPPDEK